MYIPTDRSSPQVEALRARRAFVGTLLAVALLVPPATAAKSPAPEGRTYLLFIVGLDDNRYLPEVDCMTFDSTQACTTGEAICLDWWRAESEVQTRQQVAIGFATQLAEDEATIVVDGQGRIDDRGGKSSLSLVGRAAIEGTQVNFAVAGRQIRANRCVAVAETLAAQLAVN